MINIMSSLQAYLTDNFDNFSTIVIDYFQGETEQIMLRHEPTQAKPVNYLDGSSIGTFNFSMHCKSLNGKTAVDKLNYYVEQLDLNSGFDLDPLTWVKIEPITTPRFITKTDKNEFIYSSNFSIEYKRKRG